MDLVEVKEKKREQNETYYEKHKDRFQEKVICEDCGGKYQRSCKTKHIQTKKHKEIIEKKMMENQIEELKKKLLKNNNEIN